MISYINFCPNVGGKIKSLLACKMVKFYSMDTNNSIYIVYIANRWVKTSFTFLKKQILDQDQSFSYTCRYRYIHVLTFGIGI